MQQKQEQWPQKQEPNSIITSSSVFIEREREWKKKKKLTAADWRKSAAITERERESENDEVKTEIESCKGVNKNCL